MKFSKMINVEIEAEPISEEWFIQIMSSDGNYETKHYATYKEAFDELPEEYKGITERAFAQKLNKKYKNSMKQFWTLYEHNADHADYQQACICHYYHFEFDFSTHVKF